ncbi:MAG TPA: IPExxxVDY family protein [Chitinophagaceae bacterium]|nr:IPExxxVDY family protein [Chitinophagaceae bacterium]
MAAKNIHYTLNKKTMAVQFFEDVQMIGIVSSVKDYQLCWHLNNSLGLHFTVNNELEIIWQKNKRKYHFPMYEFRERDRFLTHYIYNTQHDGEYLLPEFKYFDFLWMMKGEKIERQEFESLMEAIRSINSVQLVTEMLVDKIQNKENLIF